MVVFRKPSIISWTSRIFLIIKNLGARLKSYRLLFNIETIERNFWNLFVNFIFKVKTIFFMYRR